MTYPALSGDLTLELPEFDHPPADPIALLRDWITTAEATGVREPRVATLSTADGAGHVSARTVLVKDITDDGLLIGFSDVSRKGRDVTSNSYAAVTFYWRERAQQLHVRGHVVRASEMISDQVFAARPKSAQALAVVVRQSHPADDLDGWKRADEAVRAAAVPRPSTWSAWLVTYDELEFWHGSADRFHRRLYYLHDDDHFRSSRLQP